MRKYLLLSEPEEFNADYETLEKAYIKYRREGILYEPLCPVLLYAGAVSDRNLRSIIEFERRRLTNKKVLSKIFGKSPDKILGDVVRAIVEKLDLQEWVLVSSGAVTMKLPVAIAFGIEPDDRMILEKGTIVMGTEKGYEAIIDAYLNALASTIRDERERIIKKYGQYEDIVKFVENYFKDVVKTEGREIKTLPPCIEQILNGNVEPGSRNTALVSMINILKFLRKEFNFKISNEQLESMVREANSKFPEPLLEREVDNIIKYHIRVYADKIYNGCAMIRRESPELCPFGDHKECWRKILTDSKSKGRKPNKKNKAQERRGVKK